jgi:hypothetical protein
MSLPILTFISIITSFLCLGDPFGTPAFPWWLVVLSSLIDLFGSFEDIDIISLF